MNKNERRAIHFGLGGIIAIACLVLLVAAGATAASLANAPAFLPVVANPLVIATEYRTEFENDIAPWQPVRWQKGANFAVDHEDGCDGGHCGFLDVQVENQEMYTIASPLLLGAAPPYEITFRAKFKDRRDKHQYGVVFGADWQDGPCPGDNTNGCFNHYFEFRVRYRDVNGDQFLEYRLRRVDGHDGNNVEQGEDLVNWTRADGIDAADWVKWQVRYSSRRNITFKANNMELPGSAQDSRYDNPSYFGAFARAGDIGDAHARFDQFHIIAER